MTEEQSQIMKDRFTNYQVIKVTFEDKDNPASSKTFFFEKKRLIEALGMSEVFTGTTIDAKDNRPTCVIEELKTL